ncbi:VOC family protein [Pseudaquabacterium rugosum]|uniref:VOC family protein n=1 Tax=Pseudaquabacterium rugosum TaxID=2984194 RepID=A0ABU9B7Y0_9BURK
MAHLPEPVSKRPGVCAVHSIDHYTLTVPDLAQARDFYEAFGLRVACGEQAGRPCLDLYTHGHPQAWASLVQAPGPQRLQYLSLGLFAEDEAAFARRLDERRLHAAPHPLARDAGGWWLQAPDGLHLQLRVADKVSPSVKAPPSRVAVAPGQGAAPARSRAGRVRPRRLSHLLLFTPDVGRARGFYTGVLGLRLSDHAGDGIAFLHGAHGSDHHLIALARSSAPGLHHSSWEVGSIHELGLGAEGMRQAGHVDGWGLGRHVLGSNYFHYVRDPWGGWVEYSFDMDHIPADLDWPAADHAPEDAFYVWGPALPPDFVTHPEAATSTAR